MPELMPGSLPEVYADPVMVNGVAMTITQLAGRARSPQQAFDRLGMDIIDIVEAHGRVVIAFITRGRHAGPYLSPLGTVAPTHRDIKVRTIDVPQHRRWPHIGDLGPL